MAKIESKNIIDKAQQQIVEILKADEQLSAIPIFAENDKEIEYEIKNALGKQGICGIIITPSIKYIGDYVSTSRKLAIEVDNAELVVTENVMVNRSNLSSLTAQDTAMRAMEVLGIEHHGEFAPIQIETGEDNSLLVSKLRFKLVVIDDEYQPKPQIIIEPITITENGTYQEDGKAYTPITVNVKQQLIMKTITENGIYEATDDDVVGYTKLEVNVPVPEHKPIPTDGYANLYFAVVYTDQDGNSTRLGACFNNPEPPGPTFKYFSNQFELTIDDKVYNKIQIFLYSNQNSKCYFNLTSNEGHNYINGETEAYTNWYEELKGDITFKDSDGNELPFKVTVCRTDA